MQAKPNRLFVFFAWLFLFSVPLLMSVRNTSQYCTGTFKVLVRQIYLVSKCDSIVGDTHYVKEFYKSGRILRQYQIIGGKKLGEMRTYYDDSQSHLKSTCSYKSGKRHGIQLYFGPVSFDTVVIQNFELGHQNGIFIDYQNHKKTQYYTYCYHGKLACYVEKDGAYKSVGVHNHRRLSKLLKEKYARFLNEFENAKTPELVLLKYADSISN